MRQHAHEAMQINISLLLLLHLGSFRLLLLVVLDGLLVVLVLLELLLLINIVLLVLVVEFQRFGPVFLGVLVVVVDLHGLDRGLHRQALHALDIHVLLALLWSDPLGLSVLTSAAPSRPHLGCVDLALDLFGRVLCWLGFTTHLLVIIMTTIHRTAFKKQADALVNSMPTRNPDKLSQSSPWQLVAACFDGCICMGPLLHQYAYLQ